MNSCAMADTSGGNGGRTKAGNGFWKHGSRRQLTGIDSSRCQMHRSRNSRNLRHLHTAVGWDIRIQSMSFACRLALSGSVWHGDLHCSDKLPTGAGTSGRKMHRLSTGSGLSYGKNPRWEYSPGLQLMTAWSTWWAMLKNGVETRGERTCSTQCRSEGSGSWRGMGSV